MNSSFNMADIGKHEDTLLKNDDIIISVVSDLIASLISTIINEEENFCKINQNPIGTNEEEQLENTDTNFTYQSVFILNNNNNDENDDFLTEVSLLKLPITC